MAFVWKRLDGVSTVIVQDLQWGDGGKGKLADAMMEVWADIGVRTNGGSNSGHTVWNKGAKIVLHLLPSGIMHDKDGKPCVIASGVAVDPRMLCEEIGLLQQKGMSFNHLMVALNALLTLPTHIARDMVSEDAAGATKIGTTGRGIGPTYSDHALRIGLQVNDLLNPDILATKVKANVRYSARILKGFDPEKVKQIFQHERLCGGIYYDPEKIFNVDTIVQVYLEYGKKLAQFIRDTDTFIQANVGKKRMLLEMGQGLLLDVDHGTLPYNTSSRCTVDGALSGAGLNRFSPGKILALGIVKAYQTRVGLGPFPTELGGEDSDKWCNDPTTTREKEKAQYPDVSINDEDEFRQGIALRDKGDEFGATTKRPRRTGWLSLPDLRHSLRWGSRDVVWTKLDVLTGCHKIKVCTHYKYMGPTYRFGDKVLLQGDMLDTTIPASEVLRHCEPVYATFDGWEKSISGVTAWQDLPNEPKLILKFVTLKTRIRNRIISVGKDRDETIFV